MNDYTAE